MEHEKPNPKEKKKDNRGGARPGAGRPAGSKAQVTIENLLETLHVKTGGQHYEQLLIEDFLEARKTNDKQLVMKYHNLILNKVMNTLARIEVTDSAEAVELKKLAFADALAKLAGIKKE